MFGHHSADNELLKVFEWGVMFNFTFKKINLAAVQSSTREEGTGGGGQIRKLFCLNKRQQRPELGTEWTREKAKMRLNRFGLLVWTY